MTHKRTFLQKKLWRDNLVTIMEQNHDSFITWRSLSDQEFDQEIRIKLHEETQEVIAAQSRTELINELADVYEVMDSLKKLYSITQEEVITTQISKKNIRGGFDKRTFVETATYPVNSMGEQYCLADPEKYPEILP